MFRVPMFVSDVVFRFKVSSYVVFLYYIHTVSAQTHKHTALPLTSQTYTLKTGFQRRWETKSTLHLAIFWGEGSLKVDTGE